MLYLEQDNQIKTDIWNNCHDFEIEKLKYKRKYEICKKTLEEIIELIQRLPKDDEADWNTKGWENIKAVWRIEDKATKTIYNVDSED